MNYMKKHTHTNTRIIIYIDFALENFFSSFIEFGFYFGLKYRSLETQDR